MATQKRPLFDGPIVRRAVRDAFVKLTPRHMVRNPVMFIVLFANFAEAMAEGRGKAQADTLRKSRTETTAKKLLTPGDRTKTAVVAAPDLRRGDLVLCLPGDVIPSD